LLAGLCCLAPIDMLGSSKAGYWVGFEIIIAIIALTVWLIYLLRFNVFKKYGNIKPLHALVTFLLYFISTGIIILSVFIYPIVECVQANRAFGDEELVHDINIMNIRLCQLEHRLLNTAWNYDTVALVKGDKPVKEKTADDEIEVAPDTVAVATYGRNYYKLDSTDFYDKIEKTDSVVKLNNSLYLVYKAPELQFVSCYMLLEYTKEKVLTSFEIYNRALKHPPTPAEVRTIAKELNELQRKYIRFKKSDYITYGDAILQGDAPHDVVLKKYHVNSLNNNIWNIVSKKYSFSERHFTEFIRIFYYFTLGITLLVFIFRHTTVRTFFLSLLSGVLLAIFTAMMLSFFSYNGSATFIGWVIGYTLIFFVGSIFTFSSTKRNMLNGIFINLFVFIVPVLPLLVVDFIYEMMKDQHYLEYRTYEWPVMEQYLLYAEIGGAVLFLVLLATYINKLYRRWYSLPEH
jgi:hypothetical protein